MVSFDMLITLNPGTSNYTSVARNQGASGTGPTCSRWWETA
jgi:hypothetical protein